MSSRPHPMWLPFLQTVVPAELRTPREVAAFELAQAGLCAELSVDASLGEAFRIRRTESGYEVCGGETGILYGAYRLLMAVKAGQTVPEDRTVSPFYALRMIDCWDNMDGTIERGYAGRSLFYEGDRFDYDADRLRQLARMLASVGLNVLCINNVNVHEPAQTLIEDEGLPQLAALADLFRPFGVRLMVSVDYSQPMRHGLPTADPLDERAAAWWRERTAAVYAAVPDLAGYLVKADSEHRPGPYTYGRDHAEGANMLAKALKPFGGEVVWRCFVYNCMQDWRDKTTDRPKAAYDHYAPLDGRFDDNVILQIKNGPYDFQVREPVSPLLFAMQHTRMALEVQLAQEYTGQQVDLFAMPPMWQEIFDDLPPERVMAVAAVSNFGRDENYTGHPFAAVNLFAFGLLGWDPRTDPEACIRLWARLSYDLPEAQEDALTRMLLTSRRTYEKYTSPLGLGWMITPHFHYGPSPEGYEFTPWGTYHRADRNAVGIDRSDSGTGYAAQYPSPLRERYSRVETTPDELKLFFHRLRYDYVMDDGRTLIQRIYDDHFEGAEEVERMAQVLRTLDLPEGDKAEALRRMERQLFNAREWRDVVNTFFHRFSGVEDAHGRTIYD